MYLLSPFLTLNSSCDDALQCVKKQLFKAGLRPMQTFDLQTARHALEDYPCPYHGKSECDCQMVVLLVYGKVGEPVTLILHGNEGQTRLSLASNSLQGADTSIRAVIEKALQLNPSE